MFPRRYEQSEWGWKEREKREELGDDRAWYLIACDAAAGPVAFSHFRFDVECGEEVLYWWVENGAERGGKGLGMGQKGEERGRKGSEMGQKGAQKGVERDWEWGAKRIWKRGERGLGMGQKAPETGPWWW